MPIRRLAVAISVCLTVAGPALATDQTGVFDCGALHDPDGLVVKDFGGAIVACTRIIQGVGTPRERAIASIGRGGVHMAKARVDRANYGPESAAAAEDFDDAVNLDPKFAFAYYARGVGKMWGFRDDPMPDYGEAIRLDPNYALAFQGRAMAFELKDDLERAITDYNVAIGLDPTLGRSFAGRGVARHLNGDDDGAIVDLTEAIRLTADDPAYRLRAAQIRGAAFFAKGEFDRAIADFSEVVRIQPNYAYGYLYRGIAQLMLGSLDPARADAQHATELGPKNADLAIWREIVDRRSHAKGRLAEAEKDLDMNAWPAVVVRMLLGETTSRTLLEEANDGSEIMKRLKTCEAYVFTGELALLRQAKSEAIEGFKAAVAMCPTKYVDRSVANAELTILDAKP